MTTKRSLTNLIKRSFVEMMKDVGTSILGHFIAFNSDTQLAQIQIGIQRVDVNGKVFTPPPLIECPVYFAGGSQYFIEHQINPGDECLLVFSQRCIDAWMTTGGVANNPILRFHDFSDAVIFPGVRSQPNKIASFENNGVRLRNKAGDKFIWLKNDGTAEITVTTLKVNGNIEHAGDQTTTGTINADTSVTTPTVTASTSVTAPQVTGTTDVSFGGISGKNHTHPQANDSAGNTEQDTGGPQ